MSFSIFLFSFLENATLKKLHSQNAVLLVFSHILSSQCKAAFRTALMDMNKKKQHNPDVQIFRFPHSF